VDAASINGDAFTDVAQKFSKDAEAQNAFTASTPLATAKLDSFDVVFLCGGHGTCADFYGNKELQKALSSVVAADKVLAAVCHGPIGLVGVTRPDGSALVKGKKVTGFSKAEEDMVQLTAAVPKVPEDGLVEEGGIYSAAEAWHPHVEVDGKLVTGQNPASSLPCAEACVKVVNSKA